MKYFFIFVFIITASGFDAFGQPTAPPPAPLIYKPPVKNDLKEFVPEDEAFQIVFPGVPQTRKQPVENATVTEYRIYRQGSTSIVSVTDFNHGVEEQTDKIYELVKNSYLKLPKTKIEAEREIQTSGKLGKEFDILSDYHYLMFRVFVVGSRVYEIKSDVTNWHIIGDVTKKQFFDETERFFNSFQINKQAGIADFLGTVEKTNYKNAFFGFSLEFSNGWYRLNDEEIQASKDGGTELLKTENERVNKAFADAVKKEVVILAIARNIGDDVGSNLVIGVSKQPDSQISSEAVALSTQKFFLTNSKIKLLKSVQKIEINKVPLSVFIVENSVDENVLNQKIYVVIRRGYALSFVLTYRNSDSLTALEKIMQNLKFDAK